MLLRIPKLHFRPHFRDHAKVRQRSGERGVALIATLVFIFILTVIVVLFLNEVEDRIRYRAQTAGNDELREIAYDYLEYTFGILEEFNQFDDGFRSPDQGWGAPLQYEPFPIEHFGLVATVSVEDATDKIPLNQLSEDDFVVLMETVGIDAFTATRYRDVYFDWTDSDDDTRIQGAEKREYELNRGLLSPPNAQMESVLDFQYLEGFSKWIDPAFIDLDYNPELFNLFTGMLTVDHDYPVNINAANPQILKFFELLNQMNPEGIQRYLAGKDQTAGTFDDRIIDLSGADLPSQLRMAMGDNTSSSLFGSETHVVRVKIDLVRFETYLFHLEALVDLGGAPTTPTNGSTIIPQESEEAKPEEKGTEANANASTPSNNSTFEVLVIKENI